MSQTSHRCWNCAKPSSDRLVSHQPPLALRLAADLLYRPRTRFSNQRLRVIEAVRQRRDRNRGALIPEHDGGVAEDASASGTPQRRLGMDFDVLTLSRIGTAGLLLEIAIATISEPR